VAGVIPRPLEDKGRIDVQQIECTKSSNLQWARYFPDEQRLEIDFKRADGSFASTYEYQDFSSMDWERFVESDSKGQWFAYHVRNAKKPDGTPKYPARKIK